MAAYNSRDRIPTLYYINKVSQLLFAIKGCDNHYCVCHFLFFFFQYRCIKEQQQLISKMYRLKRFDTDKTG